MTGTEQLAKILFLTTEIGGYLIIENKLSTYTDNWMDPTIQATMFHLNQATGPGHSDQNHLPISSLNSGIGVTRSGRNIDNCTGMNPH